MIFFAKTDEVNKVLSNINFATFEEQLDVLFHAEARVRNDALIHLNYYHDEMSKVGKVIRYLKLDRTAPYHYLYNFPDKQREAIREAISTDNEALMRMYSSKRKHLQSAVIHNDNCPEDLLIELEESSHYADDAYRMLHRNTYSSLW